MIKKHAKNIVIIMMLLLSLSITGCSNNKNKFLSENMKKIELTGNLVTYEAYYHNVIEVQKKAEHLFEKDRKLFIEYTGVIKLGIDLSKVKIDVVGNQINVFIPNAKVIGEPDVDKDDFKPEKFIESKDGINKNPITADDSAEYFTKAQENMKKETQKDEELLSLAQKRAKFLIESNIKSISGISDNSYTINWEYEA